MSDQIFLIAAAGAIGVSARYYLDLMIAKITPSPLPISTLVINVVGACLAGFIYTLIVEKQIIAPNLKAPLMIGLLGGFTTFSTYALEVVRLAEAKHLTVAYSYLLFSPVAGVLAVRAGILLAHSLFLKN